MAWREACYVPSWNAEVLWADGKCAAIIKSKIIYAYTDIHLSNALYPALSLSRI